MRPRALAATAACAGLLAGAVLAGQQSASARTAGSTLKVKESFTGTNAQDVGKKGLSLGDHLAFASVVKDGTGARLGVGAGDCVLFAGTTETNAKYHCEQSYTLEGGQLLVGGQFTFAKKENTWAIMGGTGKYRGSSGEVDFKTLNATTFADTFKFD